MKYATQIPTFAALAVSAIAYAGDTPETATPFVFGEAAVGTTTGNTEALLTPSGSCGSYFTGSGPDAFYSFSLDTASTISLSLCNSSFDTDLSVHDANTLALMAGACNDDSCGSPLWQSTFSDVALPAGDYVIRIGGWNGATGDFELSGSASSGDPCEGQVPSNDAPENATPISSGAPLSGTTTCASEEGTWTAETSCGTFFSGFGADVFYSFTLDEASSVSISLCGSDFDTDLSVHNASDLTVVSGACNDDACGFPGYESEFLDVTIPAGDYLIRVGGYQGTASGDFTISFDAVVGDPCEGLVPANDLIENAIPMPLNGQITGTNVCAGSEAEFGGDCDTNAFTGGGPDVFYSLEITESTTVILSTCASDYDTDLSIHDADGNILVCDGDSADPAVCTQYTSVITATLEAGNYLVRLGGWNGDTGNFVLDSSTCSSSVYNVSSVAEVTDLLANIDACGADIINWAPGTYDFGASLNLGGTGFIHRGAVDSSGEPATIITGNDAHQCLNSFGSGAFENFVFENGRSGGDGGAFILAPSGKVTFENCVFRNNVSGAGGGAVCNLGAQNGSEFINCLFLNNSGSDAGAAFANNNGADGAIFTSCEFIGNTAANTGGAICTAGGDPTVVDCVFTNNAANSGGGIYVNGNPFFGLDTATVSGTTFCDNDPDAYAGPGIFDDQGGNEFACDEPACPEDVDENGSVDFNDLLAVLSAWGTDDAAADVDESGSVDFADVLALLSAWGSC